MCLWQRVNALKSIAIASAGHSNNTMTPDYDQMKAPVQSDELRQAACLKMSVLSPSESVPASESTARSFDQSCYLVFHITDASCRSNI